MHHYPPVYSYYLQTYFSSLGNFRFKFIYSVKTVEYKDDIKAIAFEFVTKQFN